MYPPTLPLSFSSVYCVINVQVSEKSIARQLQFILDQIECEVPVRCRTHRSSSHRIFTTACRRLTTTPLAMMPAMKKMTSL